LQIRQPPGLVEDYILDLVLPKSIKIFTNVEGPSHRGNSGDAMCHREPDCGYGRPTVQLGEDMVRRRGLCLNYSMDPSYVNLITIL